MPIDTRNRSEAPEIMDDFALEGETLRDALDKIASINKLLGGNKVTLAGVKQLIDNVKTDIEITLVDVGCGNGDMLRFLADFAHKKKLNFKLIGIDANAYTIAHAENLSAGYQNISYQCADIFEKGFILNGTDIILYTLTLHHFKDEEILKLLRLFHEKSRLGMVINDLHRSKMAYYLFKAICYAFGLNDMSREDGLVSILRGFKKADLLRYSKNLSLENFTINWKWAFRYQWIIKAT